MRHHAHGLSADGEHKHPEELNPLTDTRGDASLRGHLKAEGDEQAGSQSYIPPDPKEDNALHTALDLIRGTQKNSAYPPNPKATVPQALADVTTTVARGCRWSTD